MGGGGNGEGGKGNYNVCTCNDAKQESSTGIQNWTSIALLLSIFLKTILTAVAAADASFRTRITASGTTGSTFLHLDRIGWPVLLSNH